MITSGSCPRLARKARLRWDEKEACWFLVYPERGLRLNGSGSSILELCDGRRSVAAIIDELVARAGTAVDPERVSTEVLAFLDELARRGLIEGATP